MALRVLLVFVMLISTSRLQETTEVDTDATPSIYFSNIIVLTGIVSVSIIFSALVCLVFVHVVCCCCKRRRREALLASATDISQSHHHGDPEAYNARYRELLRQVSSDTVMKLRSMFPRRSTFMEQYTGQTPRISQPNLPHSDLAPLPKDYEVFFDGRRAKLVIQKKSTPILPGYLSTSLSSDIELDVAVKKRSDQAQKDESEASSSTATPVPGPSKLQEAERLKTAPIRSSLPVPGPSELQEAEKLKTVPIRSSLPKVPGPSKLQEAEKLKTVPIRASLPTEKSGPVQKPANHSSLPTSSRPVDQHKVQKPSPLLLTKKIPDNFDRVQRPSVQLQVGIPEAEEECAFNKVAADTASNAPVDWQEATKKQFLRKDKHTLGTIIEKDSEVQRKDITVYQVIPNKPSTRKLKHSASQSSEFITGLPVYQMIPKRPSNRRFKHSASSVLFTSSEFTTAGPSAVIQDSSYQAEPADADKRGVVDHNRIKIVVSDTNMSSSVGDQASSCFDLGPSEAEMVEALDEDELVQLQAYFYKEIEPEKMTPKVFRRILKSKLKQKQDKAPVPTKPK